MARLPHISVPVFWSIQFGLNIKSVGVPNYGDAIQFTQGSVASRSLVAAYGHQGRLVAAVTFDNAKWIDFYRREIESAAAFPPDLYALDGPATDAPVAADFPHPWVRYEPPPVVLTGHAFDEMRADIVRPPGAPS
jgi:hypothetical protein